MGILKMITGHVVSIVVGSAMLGLGVAWWNMDASTRDVILSNTGRILAWVGVVGLIPWATFFASTWVAKWESNLAGGALIVVYTAAEAWLLTYLFRGAHPGPTMWTFFVVGTLLAGVYNLLICDWIAEKMA